MSYNLTSLSNSTNLLQTFTAVNNLANGYLATMILTIAWVALFIAFKDYETLTALRSSTFIISIIAILFYTIELINIGVMLTPIILTGIFIVIGFLQER